jgi:plastocyanin
VRTLAPGLIALILIDASASPTQNPAATGTIEGRVTFLGTPPPPTIVVEGGTTQHVLYLDKSGGLRYAVVFLPGARGGAPPPSKPATVNQLWFIFEPQVSAVRAGQPVRFTNEDPAHHNVRSRDENPANTFYVDTGAGVRPAPVHRFAATPPDRPVELSCDIHPWMVAWIYVFDHGAFAATNETGHYRIERVPAGRHHLAVRHPGGGLSRDLTVDVAAGRTTRQDVRFTQADLHLAPR